VAIPLLNSESVIFPSLFESNLLKIFCESSIVRCSSNTFNKLYNSPGKIFLGKYYKNKNLE
jgi:hypothetical protein